LLNRDFDYCTKCLNHYPNRIYFSRRDDLESDGDNYRSFLVNNYRVLDERGDKITKIFTDKDQLYATTTSAVFFIPTKAQQLQSDENSIYIGTGDRLSIPPSRLVSVNYKYAGTTQEYSLVNTHFGTFYADEQSGKIFKLSDSIQEISNNGLSNFFEEHLPLQFNLVYRKATGTDYWCLDSTVDKQGIGLSAAFDSRHKRYIITKVDYELKAPYNKILMWDNPARDFTALYVNPETKSFFIMNRFGTLLPIKFGDSSVFKNIS